MMETAGKKLDAIDHFIEYQQDVFDLECNHIYRAASEQDDYLYIIRDCASRLITAKHLRLTETNWSFEMDRFDQAKEMRDAGMKLREIGEVLGVSEPLQGPSWPQRSGVKVLHKARSPCVYQGSAA
jgi:hypothetical protein